MAENQVLGRGRIFFAPYAPNAFTGGVRRYLGNTPELTMAVATQKLDHYSSETGLKVKDRSVILQEDITLTFSTDHISVGNLALWFGGAAGATGSAPADAPTDLGTLVLIGSAKQVFGSIFFESDNPVGDNLNHWFPYVSITPNGNYALKGDAWQTLSFTAEALKRDPTTERFYSFHPANGISTASTDPAVATYLSADDVGFATGTDTAASSVTVTAPTTQTHAQQYAVTFANTGGDESFLMYHNGTANVGTSVPALGANGTVEMTAPVAGTYTIKAYSKSDGSGSALGTSSSITVS